MSPTYSFVRFAFIALIGTTIAIGSIIGIVSFSARTGVSLADHIPLSETDLFVRSTRPEDIKQWMQQTLIVPENVWQAHGVFEYAIHRDDNATDGRKSILAVDGSIVSGELENDRRSARTQTLASSRLLARALRSPDTPFVWMRARALSDLPPDLLSIVRSFMDEEAEILIEKSDASAGTISIDDSALESLPVRSGKSHAEGLFIASPWSLIERLMTGLHQRKNNLAEGLTGIMRARLRGEGMDDDAMERLQRILRAPISITRSKTDDASSWIIALSRLSEEDHNVIRERLASIGHTGIRRSITLPDNRMWESVITSNDGAEDRQNGWSIIEARPSLWLAKKTDRLVLGTMKEAVYGFIAEDDGTPDLPVSLLRLDLPLSTIDAWISSTLPFLATDIRSLFDRMTEDMESTLHLNIGHEDGVIAIQWMLDTTSDVRSSERS